MAAPRGKKKVELALQQLMEEPGSDHVVMQDLLKSIETDPTQFDDRGVAIIFGAILERALELAITTHFVVSADEARRLFSYIDNGPLSGFAAKIAMGYALGVYDDRMRRDLKWIASIRNAFAHARVEVGFHTEAIIGACDQLNFPRKESPLHTRKGIVQTPRQRFTACIGIMASYLGKGPPGRPRIYLGSESYQAMYGELPRAPAETT